MRMATCSIENCDSASTRRGWCQKHYKRWKTHGDPLKTSRGGYSATPPAERFWAKVDKSDECWLWHGGATPGGYGLFSNGPGGKTVLAHRYSWALARGDIPEGLQLDHLCRVRHCVNPDHLEPVTARENTNRSFADNPGRRRRDLKTHCLHGHPYDSKNTHVTKTGQRVCRACLRARSGAMRASKRAGVPYKNPFHGPGLPVTPK